MVGIGTGFNEEIKERLTGFMNACFAGMHEQVALGMPAHKGVDLEFRELGEYFALLAMTRDVQAPAVVDILRFLETCYRTIYSELSHGASLDEAIGAQQRALETCIDRVEATHKATYGSIWDRGAD